MMGKRRNESCGRHVLVASLAAAILMGSVALGQRQAPAVKVPPTSASASGWSSVSSLEQFLNRALATHPEIVAAEVNVEAAQEELRRTRFKVARELVAFWYDWKAKERQLAEVTELAERQAVSKSQLIDAKAKLAEVESQLPYLLSQSGGLRLALVGAAAKAGPKRVPEGPLVEKIREALNQPTEMQFIETPAGDVVDIVEDFHALKFPFVVDPTVKDLPMTLDLRQIPLGAALQAAEVVTPGIRFVVCDYGLLATSDTSEAAATYVSANEFWREQQTELKPPAIAPTDLRPAREATPPSVFKPGRPTASGDPFAAPAPQRDGRERPQAPKRGENPFGADPAPRTPDTPQGAPAGGTPHADDPFGDSPPIRDQKTPQSNKDPLTKDPFAR